jgi:hypothetical protein
MWTELSTTDDSCTSAGDTTTISEASNTTASDTPAAAPTAPDERAASPWTRESKAVLALALPAILSHTFQEATNLTSQVFAGQLGLKPLAAISVAITVRPCRTYILHGSTHGKYHPLITVPPYWKGSCMAA